MQVPKRSLWQTAKRSLGAGLFLLEPSGSYVNFSYTGIFTYTLLAAAASFALSHAPTLSHTLSGYAAVSYTHLTLPTILLV